MYTVGVVRLPLPYFWVYGGEEGSLLLPAVKVREGSQH